MAIPLAASVGAVRLSLPQIMSALLHPSRATDAAVILYSLRLPRVLAAALAGSALGAAGVLFQGLFRNPLADPFVLGASGGAAVGGAVAIFFFPALTLIGAGATELLAFAGALLAMVIVWLLARPRGPSALESLLLAGFAFGTLLNAVTAALELHQEATSPGTRILEAWLHGEVTIPTWPQLGFIAALQLAALLCALPLSPRLNTLALSEEYAAQLGIRVERLRLIAVVLGSLLTGLAVSLSGLIGFVGLLVPHFLRLLLGPDHVRLLPASALGGALFLLMADTIARSAFAPSEIPVGILTAFLGAPAFLYLLHQREKGAAAS